VENVLPFSPLHQTFHISRNRQQNNNSRPNSSLQVKNFNQPQKKISLETEQNSSKTTLSIPDYLITDSISIPNDQRPTLYNALSNPRDILAILLVLVGTVMSIFNTIGQYNETYLQLESVAITLGFLSALAHFIQINTGYFISSNIRRGIVDDAVINAYAAFYSGAVSWLALRSSEICPHFLTHKVVDIVLSSFCIIIFVSSLVAPLLTLAADTSPIGDNINNDKDSKGGNMAYRLCQWMVASIRSFSEEGNINQEDDKQPLLPPLSETEVLRARGLVFIGLFGCVFTPDAISFLIGGEEWWSRVSSAHISQRMLESSTSLFALFATESSMIAHRVGKVGVAPYMTIVPFFAGVCFLLAIIPCICALYWLGDDVSFFSFYRE